MPIASTIKALREQQGLSRLELARRSGVHHQTIANVEEGKSSPTEEMLGKLAHGLGKTLVIRFE
jgi:transcriptional regulator with XRE-family HTH domain